MIWNLAQFFITSLSIRTAISIAVNLSHLDRGDNSQISVHVFFGLPQQVEVSNIEIHGTAIRDESISLFCKTETP